MDDFLYMLPRVHVASTLECNHMENDTCTHNETYIYMLKFIYGDDHLYMCNHMCRYIEHHNA